ncbi:MAG: tyrosine-protein phosphatase [Eubacteriaceae bacterium]
MKKTTVILFAGLVAAIPAFIYTRKQFTNKKALKIAPPQESPEPEVSPFESPIYDFKSEDNLIFCDETQLGKRLIQLENSINIRDIGGYTGFDGKKVKWRKIVRSEELAHLSENDVTYFENLGLKHAFDFRDSAKAKRNPDRLPSTTQYHPSPVFDSATLSPKEVDFREPGSVDAFMQEVYRIQTKECPQVYANVLKYMADSKQFPLLYHCTNGKDRTGFMTYLLLSLLGVKEETIVSDYTLTNLTVDESYQLLGSILSTELNVDPHYLWEFYGVKPAWLKISIDYIKENFGNVENYLLSETDLTEEDIQKIRDNLLE